MLIGIRPFAVATALLATLSASHAAERYQLLTGNIGRAQEEIAI